MAGAAAEQRRFATVVESWLGRPVLIVGDAMLDEWRFADSDRLCREAPAPVLTLRRRISAAGGAANTAVNVAALGGRAVLVAPVGADVAGDELHDCLDRASVWDRTVNQPGRPTPVKRRMLAGNQILLREDSGDPEDALDHDGVSRLLTALSCATEELRAAAGGEAPTLVVCDYGLGALPAPVRAWLVENRQRYATVALDAHDLADWRGLAPTVVTPSFAEATRLLARAGGTTRPTGGTELHLEHPDGDPVDGPSEMTVGAAPGAVRADDTAAEPTRADRPGPVGEPTPGEGRVALTGDGLSVTGTGVTVNTRAGEGVDRAVLAKSRLAELRAHTGADVVAVTLDTEGAVVGGADGEPRRSHSTPVPASHAVGAGDAYLAAMTLALAADAPLPTAAQLAQLAATITVSDTGTCVCRRDDLLAALDQPTDTTSHPALVGGDELDAIVAEYREAGRSVVFTNGCFDVLHRGHVRYLEQARALGDLLIVAVNSDGSVRRLKGPDRPVNPVEDRGALLAALACVDHVVVFEEDSPAALIEAVRPDVYVKGGDYPPELVPEAPLVRRLGGQVRTLGYVPDRSTSAIIERIRSHSQDPSPHIDDREPDPSLRTRTQAS
ncbi:MULTISPECIES: D-glycero-beta-D-manno-heptose 1-phosphate adenylyltransferase [Micromonospora]|uniref:D-glycero-beta-D-manno-heptose 1-phosphate adenylyltransferase n=1 Tax=Micromonospora TaxID=1873 RepID=UPI001EE7D554|nr:MULTISPECIES: D-glycero-beta-D-manno-heptose 1-phosphate adenylyltransferase [Micromonospora]MCG5449268.1 D-glycero-beta-D-manno-heptose 1-phosphate adenylyltransferase [Micromonospora hortensis]MCX5119173.1 D-glycero-beta-D-manno-heptose 1-phosphate adenylyltransferase [Micromonospora sp. NBC_00362]WTI08708.1 D-glycero-beta-D-manno-heptose 1-phosphate adenylyltransferase [Micromonospora sp. NBC_00821]